MWAVEQRHPAAVAALIDGKTDVSAKSGGAGLPRNYMANRVNSARVEAANRIRAAAAKAGRTYEEELEIEQKNGTIAVRRIGDATSFFNQQGGQAGRNQQNAQAGQAAQAAQAAAAQDQDDTDVIVAGLVGTGGGGLTALVLAGREGDLESTKLLLAAGA